jgi:uncharacterized protein (TIGR01777 family)
MDVDHEKYRFISADTTLPGSWQDELKTVDAVINLAGATIFNRWTQAYRQLMYESRILTTRNIVDAMAGNGNAVLVNASAVGYYGDRKDDILMESEPPGTDFLARLAVDWEAEALKAKETGARVAITRFGVIMGKDGGALDTMVPLFRRYLGGPLGWGRQWFPWIHMDDVIHAIHQIMENKDISGQVNVTAPIPIRQRAFAGALGRQLRRPAFMPVPPFMIRLIMGELGAALLASQKVMPGQLIRHKYKFKYMEIEPALADILSVPS